MANGRQDLDAMAESLAEWLATGPDMTDEDLRLAREVLGALGVPALLGELAMAERVLRFANSFHTVARFFADGSTEQRYLRSLTDGAGEERA